MTKERNTIKYREALGDISEVISSLTPHVLSVFGAGHWFCDENSPRSDVDVIAVVSDGETVTEEYLLDQLKAAGHTSLGGAPVKARLFWIEELEGRCVGKCAIAASQSTLRVFIRHFAYYTLLHGKAWPLSPDTLAPLPFGEETEYWRALLLSFRLQEVLSPGRRQEDYRTWDYFLKLYLFFRIAGLAAEGKLSYTYSFRKVNSWAKRTEDTLVQLAYEYRYASQPIGNHDRLAFFGLVREQLAASSCAAHEVKKA